MSDNSKVIAALEMLLLNVRTALGSYNEEGESLVGIFIKLTTKNEQLQKENDALRARVARLEGAINNVEARTYEDWLLRLNTAYSETPQQSLAEIQAEAVEKFMDTAERYISDDQSQGLNNALSEFERQQGGE